MRIFGLIVDVLIFLFTSSQRDVAAAGAIGGICPGIMVSLLLKYQHPVDKPFFSLFTFGIVALFAGAYLGAFVGWLVRVLSPNLDSRWIDLGAAFLGGFACGSVILALLFPGAFPVRFPLLAINPGYLV